MGYTRALELAGHTAKGTINLETALVDHFTANMYPPVPAAMIPTAKDAIDKVVEERGGEILPVPDHVLMRNPQGERIEKMSAHEWVDILRLEAFVAFRREAGSA